MVYEIIGLGFGPANLAIAAAILDRSGAPSASEEHQKLPKRSLFIEKNTEFRWHPGMLLPGTRMQISYLKDLATLRSPQSSFTFLAYLHDQDRLLPFINRGSSTPTRQEYSDYLSWAAEKAQEGGIDVRYGEEVIRISLTEDRLIEVLSRRICNGEEVSRHAKNLIISPGGTARIPAVLSLLLPHPRLIHSSTYATSIPDLLTSAMTSKPEDQIKRIAIVGAGQSAAEIILDLHSRLGSTQSKYHIDLVFRKGCMRPSDDSPFANEIFDPTSTDQIFDLPKRSRENILEEYHNTNYSVVNPRTLDALYEVIYHQKLNDSMSLRGKIDSSNVRICLRPYTCISSAEDVASTSQIRLTLQNLLSRESVDEIYDIVICGTGYERSSWVQLVSEPGVAKYLGIDLDASNLELEPFVESHSFVLPTQGDHITWRTSTMAPASSSCGTPLSSPGPSPSLSTSQLSSLHSSTKLYISRNYRLLPVASQATADRSNPGIYLQGCTEATHGLSESLLSIVGIRAGLVVEDLLRAV